MKNQKTYTVDVVYYYDHRYSHYVRYNDVPGWRKEQMANQGGDYIGLWTKKIFVDGKEVSE